MLHRLYLSDLVSDAAVGGWQARIADSQASLTAMLTHPATRRGLAWSTAPTAVHDRLYGLRHVVPGAVTYVGLPCATLEALCFDLRTTLRARPEPWRAAMRAAVLAVGFDLDTVTQDLPTEMALRWVAEGILRAQRAAGPDAHLPFDLSGPIHLGGLTL